MKSFLRRFKDQIAAGIIVLLGATFFWDTLIGRNVFFTGDNLSLNVPAKILIADAFKNHAIPLWNPYILSGIPFLADIGLGVFAPLNFIFLLTTPLRALTLTIIVDVVLSGLFMYLYLRILNKRVLHALGGSIVFMLSGSMLQFSMNISILNVLVWIPLVMTCVELTLARKSVGWALMTSIFLSIMVFSGHVQFLYYTLLFVIFYTLSYPGISFRRRIASLLTFFLPVIFLTAVQLLPFLEFVRYSTRPVRDLSYAAFASPAISLIRLILPNAFGILKDGTSWGAMADINGYVGIIPLLLILILLGVKQKPFYVKFYGIASLIALGIAIGRHSPVFLTAFYTLPLFSLFRSPQSILIMYTFGLSVLTAFGLDAVTQLRARSKYRYMDIIALAGLILIICFQLFLGFPFFLNNLQYAASHFAHPFIVRFLAYTPYQQETIYNMWIVNIVVLNMLVLTGNYLINLLQQKSYRGLATALLLAIISIDLFLFGKNMYIVTEEKMLYQSHELTNLTKTDDPAQYRVLTIQDEGKKPVFGDRLYFLDEARKTMAFDQVNANVYNRLRSIDGYSAIVHRDYASLLDPRNNRIPTGVGIPKPGSITLDELSVKYLITGGRYSQELDNATSYEAFMKYGRFDLKKTFTIYKNTRALPRSYVINPNGTITPSAIINENMREIEIQTNATEGGRLILTDLYYPGWQAWINGERAAINKQGIFRSVDLPKKQSIVLFSYSPYLFTGGLIISAVNWIGISGFLIFYFLKKQKQEVRKKFHPNKSKIKKNA